MSSKKHILNDLWIKNYEIHLNEDKYEPPLSVEEIAANVFSIGDFYHFTIDFKDQSVHHLHPNLIKMHGLKHSPTHVSEIIELAHPEDLHYIQLAESWCFQKGKEIGYENRFSFKASYCFRMKMADDSYQMIHHQALIIKHNTLEPFARAINIHTNINHITTSNSFIATLSSLFPLKDIYQTKFTSDQLQPTQKTLLSAREREIVRLVAKGLSSEEIAKSLFLSLHTIKTHRKNILKKTGSNSSSELIKLAFETGLL